MKISTTSVTLYVNRALRTIRFQRTGVTYGAGYVLCCLPKGEARQVRKALREAGLKKEAASQVSRLAPGSLPVF
jgi:hypothetical protein